MVFASAQKPRALNTKPWLIAPCCQQLIRHLLQLTRELKLIETFEIPVMLVSSNQIIQQKVQPQNVQNILKGLRQDLILPSEEMILAKETQSFLKNWRVDAKTVLTSNILACIVRAVQERLGAAFLPIAYVNRELRNGSLQAYGPRDGFWQHSIYLYTSKGNTNKNIPSLAKILRDSSVLKYAVQEINL